MWTRVVIGLMALSLLSGCAAGPEGSVSSSGKYIIQGGKWVPYTQALTQTEAPNPTPNANVNPNPTVNVNAMAKANANQNLQNQLMVKGSQAAPANYKDYQVGPEDQLDIVVYGQDALNRTLRVNGQGDIVMPLVGVVKVAGLTTQEIEKRLSDLYNANYLVNPQITVEVREYRHQRVAVTGAVMKPGSYELIGPRTLLEVLAMAGGIANQGSTTGGGGGALAGDVVDVIRHENAPELDKTIKAGAVQPFAPKTETMVINLRRLMSGEDPRSNIMVRNGDVVYVPNAGTAYVLGAVKKPGLIVVKQNLTVSQAIALAGDIDPMLANYNITIMRFDEHGNPIAISANLSRIEARKEPDIPIKTNDVVVAKENSVKKALWYFKNILPVSGGYSVGSAF
ncbi:MAG: polysaccharide biosynthesis/export family protein [Desulfobaccales bacterium]